MLPTNPVSLHNRVIGANAVRMDAEFYGSHGSHIYIKNENIS